nr:immunoglobulin light chain junction region [Macaca mulatta]MOX49246.1 immunoglobulin light chain junction region [Macaca mulatta]
CQHYNDFHPYSF